MGIKLFADKTSFLNMKRLEINKWGKSRCFIKFKLLAWPDLLLLVLLERLQLLVHVVVGTAKLLKRL